MSLKTILFLLVPTMLGASPCSATTVTITNTENEDLSVYVVDHNAQGGPVVFPASGTGCVSVAAGNSATFDATLDANGNYNLTWTAEQPLANPVIKSSTCSADPSQPCNVDMSGADFAQPHCQQPAQ